MSTVKCMLVGLILGAASTRANDVVIESFDSNGHLVATGLLPGSIATVEWASSLDGPWTNTWESLSDVLVDSNGHISVDVPMFYRVRGIANQPLVEPAVVAVGDAGNGPDDFVQFGITGEFGAVPYDFQIGKFEVTNAEYVEFLNAVDPVGTNEFALYNPKMKTEIWGGISNDVTAVAGERYVAKAGRENKPVVYVSFYDAVRFCNWLHNGALPDADTEDGAYTLLGETPVPTNGTNVLRNAGARFALPTADEWYKAAYYDPVNPGADVNGTAADYWYYPTMNDNEPLAEAPSAGTNSANFRFNAVGDVTDVGAYVNSASYHGTFDQGGNVWEISESLYGSKGIVVGDGWAGTTDFMKSRAFNYPAFRDGEFSDRGFRVARYAANRFTVTASDTADYTINTLFDPTLELVRGETYTFNIDAPGHPFWIKTAAGNGTGNAYHDGVTGNGTSNGTLTFTVPLDAPDNLHYNCQFHVPMTGTINILD